MARGKKPAKTRALNDEVLACSAYKSPAFETISEAKNAPKPANARVKRKEKALESKGFSIESLFLTGG